MEILTQGIQSYQTNQSHAGWVEQTEASQAAAPESDPQNDPGDDRVSLSNTQDIYNWLAQEFPLDSANAETIVRLNQQLFDYQIFDLQDMHTVNQMLNDDSIPGFLHRIESSFTEATSFQHRQQLGHIRRVYATLDASSQQRAYA